MGWLHLGGRGARGYARDDAWERLCTRTCDTLCERPSGMPFICVVIGLQIGHGYNKPRTRFPTLNGLASAG